MRLDVKKTYKMYVGGQFVRGESGRIAAATSPSGEHLDNVCVASRKDFRDAVVAARAAQPGWAARTAYLRGQILYRAAEMLQQRGAELEHEIIRSTGVRRPQAAREVAASVDRLVYWAGWTDKIAQVFGSVNPVSSPHFNFTMPEPSGVAALVAPDEPALLALISLVAPAILSGNTVVALASARYPLPALTLGEVLATSDLPGGVVNLLSGGRADLAPHLASHMDVNAIIDAGGDDAVSAVLRGGTAANLKRFALREIEPPAWFGDTALDPHWALDTLEFKTAWHPMGF